LLFLAIEETILLHCRMKKLTCVVGTRPQLIKHAVLLPQLKKFFDVSSIDTHQHYDADLNSAIKHDLYDNDPFVCLTPAEGFSNTERLEKMVAEVSQVLTTNTTDAVLVYGDTDSTLAGSIVAAKLCIRLIHVEAGERSMNTQMPEEQNRIIADLLAHVHFCSSRPALSHLKNRMNSGDIYYAGDLMKDLLMKKSSELNFPLVEPPYLFCTIHRNYNQQNIGKLEKLLEVLQGIGVKTIFPLHPLTRKTLLDSGVEFSNYSCIQFANPVSYLMSIHYQKYANCVITDSGGMQKEAYWLKTPCVTFRKETEWPETLIGNWNQLVYDDIDSLPMVWKNTPDSSAYKDDLYGDGEASAFIASQLAALI
jgi:UDP-GlcNAc3NAcA epimerase